MKALILAGGSGTRLWPLSREKHPKQLLRLHRDQSFLQRTFLRIAKGIGTDGIYTITSWDTYHDIVHQLDAICPGAGQRVIIEPCARNTAPAVALALRHIEHHVGITNNELIFVSPSDHMIPDHAVFAQKLCHARDLAHETQGLVVFGITPSRAETGYGYIELGAKAVDQDVYAVKSFKEKPDSTTAQQYVDSGNYLWNAGMLVAPVGVLQAEFTHHMPEIAALASKSYRDAVASFSAMPDISLDNGILEHTHNVSAIALGCRWSDIGSWDSLYDVLDKDEKGNVALSDALTVNSHNNLLVGNSRLIATQDVDDLIVIDTQDALLVSRRGSSQQIKKLVNQLIEQNRKEVVHTPSKHRPWGHFTILEKHTLYQIRRLSVLPHAVVQPQLHRNRTEHWIVLSGKAEAQIGELTKKLEQGMSAYIPPNTRHQLRNLSEKPLEVIEVQAGMPVDDDDIVRFEPLVVT